jgi:hypothetical protein
MMGNIRGKDSRGDKGDKGDIGMKGLKVLNDFSKVDNSI